MEKENKKLEIQCITEINAKGKMTAIASDESIDRYGDSIKVKDWNFAQWKKNPVLQAGHDYRPQMTVGVGKNIRVEGKKVLFDVEFHDITPLAREIGQMYREGILKAWSVGFMPAQEEGGKHELLEVSAVAVPANANCLITAKGMKPEEEKEVGNKIKEFVNKEITPEEKPEEEKPEEVPEEKPEATPSPSIAPESLEEDEEIVVTEEGGDERVIKKVEKKEVNFAKRWNKQLPEVFNKALDIDSVPSNPASYCYEIYSKYLGCKVKHIYLNSFVIPSPMLGSYLNAFKNLLSEFDLKDERNFSYGGGESPLVYETIQLTAETTGDFLIQGTQFYTKKGSDDNRFIVKVSPSWYGLEIDLVSKTSDREWNKKFLDEVTKYAKENNLLKGQIFSLSGEFLKKTKDNWEDLVLEDKIVSPIKKAMKQLKNKGADAKSRGLMFVGPPGTGKTKSGKILMNDYDKAAFIWVSSRDFGYVGSVRALKVAFDLARDIAPAILFFEDIDQWITTNAMDLLKTEMDGIKENRGIITILTSNTPEKFPDALLDRPGRFHDILNFELPTKELRKEMLVKWLDDGIDKVMEKVLEKTEGFSGAHMRELVDYAQMIAEDDDIKMGEALLKSLEKIVNQRKLISDLRTDEKSVVSARDIVKDMLKSKKKSTEILDDLILSLKDGRVISEKNRNIIKDAIVALEKLLELSEKPTEDTPEKSKGNDSDNKLKGRNPKVAQKSVKLMEEQLIVRALQTIAKNTNFALYKLKK